MTKNNEVVIKCWLQKRGDMRATNWHIKDLTIKDIFYVTLCGEMMSLDVDTKWENDDDYKWQFGHYFVPEKVCKKCEKVSLIKEGK